MGDRRNAYRGYWWERIPLGRPRHSWVNNIKMGLRGMGWDGMGWTGLIWLRIETSGGLL
jgi:hypothetical protein